MKQPTQTRGGKREGAGRPKTGKTTKTIRVPKNFPDRHQIDAVLETLKEYSDKSNRASQTSPRWQKLRELLSEIDEILNYI